MIRRLILWGEVLLMSFVVSATDIITVQGTAADLGEVTLPIQFSGHLISHSTSTGIPDAAYDTVYFTPLVSGQYAVRLSADCDYGVSHLIKISLGTEDAPNLVEWTGAGSSLFSFSSGVGYVIRVEMYPPTYFTPSQYAYTVEVNQVGQIKQMHISAPNSTFPDAVTHCSCQVTYADDVVRTISPIWTIKTGSDIATIGKSGAVSFHDVNAAKSVTICAEYSEEGRTWTAEHELEVAPAKQPLGLRVRSSWEDSSTYGLYASSLSSNMFLLFSRLDWGVETEASWIQLGFSGSSADTSGVGVGFTVLANSSGVPRSADIKVTAGSETKTFTVKQAGSTYDAVVTFDQNGARTRGHKDRLGDLEREVQELILSLRDTVMPLLTDRQYSVSSWQIQEAIRKQVNYYITGLEWCPDATQQSVALYFLRQGICYRIAGSGYDTSGIKDAVERETSQGRAMISLGCQIIGRVHDMIDLNKAILDLDTLDRRYVTVSYPVGALPMPEAVEGYEFAGWWTLPFGGEEVLSSYRTSSDKTVYAHWVLKSAVSFEDVHVLFDANGGKCDTSEVVVRKNAELSELPIPTWDGYEFLGWFTAAVGGTQVTAATVVTEDVTFYAHWRQGGETPPPLYGPWGEAEAVKNPDKLGPTMLTDMSLTINGAAGAMGDVAAAFRGDTGALCGLGKVMDAPGTLTMACYAPTGVKLHFKVWVAASGIENPVVLDCDARSDLAAPTSGAFLSGHALVVSDNKDLTISLGSADWHTVSFNVLPDDPSPAAVFGSVKAKIAAVTQGIEFWMPGKSSSLKAIEIGKGYWVNTKVDDVEWTVSGKTDPKRKIALEEGWNLVGYAPEAEGAVQAVLKTALAAKAVDYVTYGVEFYPGGTLKKMAPGKAYWVHAKKSYTLVYDDAGATYGGEGARRPTLMASASVLGAAVPTYGPWGESEAVKNPDKLGPTFLTDMEVEIDGEPAEYGDVVAAFRGDTGALCGLGKVMDDSGTLTVVCYAPKGVTLSFKVWLSESGVEEAVVVKCDSASKLSAPESGAFYDGHAVSCSTAELIETIVPGEKVTIDTGYKGYTVSGLPSGLKYSKTSGLITGAATKPTAAEGVVVKFTKSGAETEELTIVVRAEEISAGCKGLSSGPLPAGVVGAADGMDIEIDSEGGTKSVSVTKLPSGMKYDKKSGKITGAPTKAGDYEIVVTVTTAYGNKESFKIPVSVVAMPVVAVGKFNGFVSVGEDYLGAFTLTTTDAGKLTAKVVTAAGTVSFSGTCWDAVVNGVYRATLTTKKGERLALTLDTTADWDANQLTGSFTTAAVAATKKTAAVPSRTYGVSAQRNAFGKTWYFAATGDEQRGWTLSAAESAKVAALTVTLKADGTTALAGKLPGLPDAKGKSVTFKVSASGAVNLGGIREGALMADFAPVLTINKVKKVLSITTNLWLDRTTDHTGNFGGAKIAE